MTTPTDAVDAGAQKPNTPTPVKIVSLLALLVGILSVLGGVLLIFSGFAAALAVGESRGLLFAQGILYLILGFAALAVYKGLTRGDNWARIVFTIVLVVAILVDIYSISVGRGSSAWWGIAVDVIALIALYGPQACRDFFSNTSTSA